MLLISGIMNYNTNEGKEGASYAYPDSFIDLDAKSIVIQYVYSK
jgi:hypothetical protein